MPRRAPAAALAALLAAAAAAGAQPQGKAPPRAEILELMDRVIADPADARARDGLSAAAGRAAAAEKAAAREERLALLASAGEARRRNDGLAAARKKRLSAWRKRFSKACSLASDADTAAAAVDLYEQLLRNFPVYSDGKDFFLDSSAKLRAIFFRTIKRAYPYLAEGRESADERMLAALQFSRVSERQSAFGGLPPARVAEAQLKKAEQLSRLEAVLKGLHDRMRNALALYSSGRLEEAEAEFLAVLEFDWQNEEALHYLSLARAKLKSGSGKR
jgi:hypothetical protein